jgi:hypothetical protein
MHACRNLEKLLVWLETFNADDAIADLEMVLGRKPQLYHDCHELVKENSVFVLQQVLRSLQ